MTTNEILKVKDLLNRANCIGRECKNCPYYDTNECINKADTHFLRKYVYELKDEINRKDAEIEELKDILYDADGVNLVNYWHQQCKIVENGCRNFEEQNENLKAEIERLEKVQVQYVKAYFDEFAERLKNDFRLAQLDIGLTSAVVDELAETMSNEFNTLADFTDLIKAEAVKEFEERLNDYVIEAVVTDEPQKKVRILFADDIVKVKKEMAGER